MKQKFLNTIFYIIYAYVGLCTLYLLIIHFSFYSWNIPADIVVILVIVYQLTVGSNRYQISYSSEKNNRRIADIANGDCCNVFDCNAAVSVVFTITR